LTARGAELGSLSDAILTHRKVFFDTSGLKDGLFIVEKLLKTFSPEKMLYGSLHPLFTLKSTLLLVEKADVNDQVKEEILGAVKFKQN
jgi:predicted TIM-barrel fold metal-dependent hydrolase